MINGIIIIVYLKPDHPLKEYAYFIGIGFIRNSGTIRVVYKITKQIVQIIFKEESIYRITSGKYSVLCILAVNLLKSVNTNLHD